MPRQLAGRDSEEHLSENAHLCLWAEWIRYPKLQNKRFYNLFLRDIGEFFAETIGAARTGCPVPFGSLFAHLPFDWKPLESKFFTSSWNVSWLRVTKKSRCTRRRAPFIFYPKIHEFLFSGSIAVTKKLLESQVLVYVFQILIYICSKAFLARKNFNK